MPKREKRKKEPGKLRKGWNAVRNKIRPAPPKSFLVEIAENPDPAILIQRMLPTYGRSMHMGAVGGYWVRTRKERHLLVLGPPRSGKTSAILAPLILSTYGPVVSTSTKADLFVATSLARSLLTAPDFPLWTFDPGGTSGGTDGADQLRWSPLRASREWDMALVMANQMVQATRPPRGSPEAQHWSERAGSLIAPLFHAGAVEDVGMRVVMHWILARDGETPEKILAERGPNLALSVLRGILVTDVRELSGIWSTAQSVLAAYATDAGLRACDNPNFDPDRFVQTVPASSTTFLDKNQQVIEFPRNGTDIIASTIYTMAPASQQALVAPIIVGLLTEIRYAAYAYARSQEAAGIHAHPAVVFALDELANVAPLPDLPALLSEGGSQGLLIAGAFQDLSQARDKYGEAAKGFLTLFGDSIILPGVLDRDTIEVVSLLGGDYDRYVNTWSLSSGGGAVSQQMMRERRVPPDVVARGEGGDNMTWVLQGRGPVWIDLTPYYRSSPWPQLLVRCMEHAYLRSTRGGGTAPPYNWLEATKPFDALPSPRLNLAGELGERYRRARLGPSP